MTHRQVDLLIVVLALIFAIIMVILSITTLR